MTYRPMVVQYNPFCRFVCFEVTYFQVFGMTSKFFKKANHQNQWVSHWSHWCQRFGDWIAETSSRNGGSGGGRRSSVFGVGMAAQTTGLPEQHWTADTGCPAHQTGDLATKQGEGKPCVFL